jgi:predicted ArsR family transcriptional regulator
MKEDKTSKRILELLKWKGPLSQDYLSNQLGLSTMAVSKHLNNFQSQNFVDYTEEKKERGRPIKMWFATKKADELFTNSHSSLAVSLIKNAKETLGETAVETMVKAHSESKIEDYLSQIDTKGSFGERVVQYTEVRRKEGYMAECKDLGEGVYELVENHCPIGNAASVCHELCDAEVRVMQTLLGNVEIERTEHIQNEQRRCVYNIRSKD